MQKHTYRLQSPSCQNALRRGRNVATIPLQVPHDIARAQLREHLRYLLHLRWVDHIPATAVASRAGIIVAVKEPSENEKGDDGEGEKRRDVEGGFLVGHYSGEGIADGVGLTLIAMIEVLRYQTERIALIGIFAI